jgi:hypothetical protein
MSLLTRRNMRSPLRALILTISSKGRIVLKDGIALPALIEDLAPGLIKLDELKPKNAVENLRNEFHIAETPDEKAVENYLCMLVSAQKAQVKQVCGFELWRHNV